MWDKFVTVLHDISELLIAVGVIAGLVQSWLNGRALNSIHKATNSLTDRLVATTAVSAEASGFEKGRQQQIIESDQRIKSDGSSV